jgi:hypothetical protein
MTHLVTQNYHQLNDNVTHNIKRLQIVLPIQLKYKLICGFESFLSTINPDKRLKFSFQKRTFHHFESFHKSNLTYQNILK